MIYYITKPHWKGWKNSDEKLSEHKYGIKVKVKFKKKNRRDLFVDLTEYYQWAEYNNIKMEHYMLYGDTYQKSMIMFVLNDETYLMAFKLRWL